MTADTAWTLVIAVGSVAILGFIAKYLRLGNCTGPCEHRRIAGTTCDAGASDADKRDAAKVDAAVVERMATKT